MGAPELNQLGPSFQLSSLLSSLKSQQCGTLWNLDLEEIFLVPYVSLSDCEQD